ncbi:hypothetical protein OsJ_19055 [Oryza sativa Japonica Group]|uniref:Uncharacterized protein n=1 Tax=Oryza sativa subsp. japonica TaxID=39947 RepID=B9FK76_ORYSJ|nr:hypothetical protein OsJ_19055 [Oryza sativa Japonica Group]
MDSRLRVLALLILLPRFFTLLAISSVFFTSRVIGAEGAIGVNYGMLGNNLPSPAQVISMYKAKNINYVRLFHPDTAVLAALRNSGIGVVLGTYNEDLARLASDPSFAASWVSSYVQPFAGAVSFRYINAGNEVIPGDPAANVLPAMRNLDAALKAAGISGIPVTTAVATSVLGVSYPPSQGAFSEAASPYMAPIVAYLASRGAPLLVNVYPYFAYAADAERVQLGYALLSASQSASVTDGGVTYTNMFDAIVDAAHAAGGEGDGRAGGGAGGVGDRLAVRWRRRGRHRGERGGVQQQPDPPRLRRRRDAAAAGEAGGDVPVRHVQREPEARGRGAAFRPLPARHDRSLPCRLRGLQLD